MKENFSNFYKIKIWLIILLISISTISCLGWPCRGIPKKKYLRCGCHPAVRPSIDMLTASKLPQNLRTEIQKCIRLSADIDTEIKESEIKACVEKKIKLDDRIIGIIDNIITNISKIPISEHDISRWNDCFYNPNDDKKTYLKPLLLGGVGLACGIISYEFNQKSKDYNDRYLKELNRDEGNRLEDKAENYKNLSIAAGVSSSIIFLGCAYHYWWPYWPKRKKEPSQDKGEKIKIYFAPQKQKLFLAFKF